MRAGIALAIQLYLVIIAIDILIAWVQPDPERWPRRLTHLLTEPLQVPLRVALDRLPLGGWDLSAVVLVLLLGAARVVLIQP